MKKIKNSILAKKTYNYWLKNKEKIFSYEKDKIYLGLDLIKKIDFFSNKIRSFNINNGTIFINSFNSFEWISIYLASKINNISIIIIPTTVDLNKISKLKKIINPNLIFTKNKLKFQKSKNNIFFKYIKNEINIKKNLTYEFLFTTGTTSLPKGVCISERAYLTTSKYLIKLLKQKRNDCELLSMPFSHSFGLTRLRTCLYNYQSIYITDGLKNIPEIFKNIKNYDVKGLSLVPSALELLKLFINKKIKEISSQINYMEIGSSSLNLQMRKWLKKNFHKAVIQHHFGTTEASRSFFVPRGFRDNLKIKSNWIGYRANYVKFKVTNLKDPKKNGKTGELNISGKNLASGYIFNKDNKNFLDNYFKTSDIVKIINKKIYFLGRKDSIIDIGGEKILPEEYEDKIEMIKDVKICLCGTFPDKIMGHRIAAIIVPRKNSQKYKKYIKSKIDDIFRNEAIYKKPNIIKFKKKIKLTFNGKKNRKLKYFYSLVK